MNDLDAAQRRSKKVKEGKRRKSEHKKGIIF
jgi:hypothetical protein